MYQVETCVPTTRLYLTSRQGTCVCRNSIIRHHEWWERDQSDQANMWQVHQSTDVCRMDQSCEQHYGYELDCLYSA